MSDRTFRSHEPGCEKRNVTVVDGTFGKFPVWLQMTGGSCLLPADEARDLAHAILARCGDPVPAEPVAVAPVAFGEGRRSAFA